MQIESVQIMNFRSVRNVKLTVSPLTGLVGGNNAGKSTILKAIELFFESAPKISAEDFSVGDEERPIDITITFCRLTPVEIEEFGSAVIEGRLTVTRQFILGEKDSGQYFASAMVSPKFSDIRSETNGTKRLAAYRALRKEHDDLPEVKNMTEIDPALAAWEDAHKGELEVQRIKGFFGAQNVANGSFGRRLLFISYRPCAMRRRRPLIRSAAQS